VRRFDVQLAGAGPCESSSPKNKYG